MKREVKILALSYSQSQIGSYVCVLGEVNGHRKLPIVIKPQDAQTISLRIENMKSPRPLTHDLIKSVCDSFYVECSEVYIHNILEGIFYCKLSMNNGVDDADIECTSGDAIALSLVFECPLYVSEEVLSVSGIIIGDSGDVQDDEAPVVKKTKKKKSDTPSLESLNKMMQDAITNEEYELAAQYRDKIAEMKKNEKG